jgi:integrase
MAAVNPIKDRKQLKLAGKFISKQQLGYQAIYHIGISTGLRCTDITELEWANINFDKGTVTVNENKGTRAAKARARLKVLEQVKGELIALNSDDTKAMMNIFITKPKNIYSLIPGNLKASVDHRIKEAIAKAPAKSRTAKLSPKALTALRSLNSKNSKIDGGLIFSRNTFKSNRAKNTDGVISRQSVYRLFKLLEAYLVSIGEKVSNLGAHSARKIAAWCLYTASNHNIALVMKAMGWSSEVMVLRYLAIGDSEEQDAFELAHKGM